MRNPLILTGLMWLATAAMAAPMNYQGQLQDKSGPYTGTPNMEFRLYDSLTAGNPMSLPISKENVPVNDGLFQVALDFGLVSSGEPLYLSVSVDGEVLTPRQKVATVPVAQYALSAGGALWETQFDGIRYERDGLKLSFAPSTFDTQTAPRILMGHPANESAIGATVSGGGTAATPNKAENAFATIGGGRGNSAGTGATIAGGTTNFARIGGAVGGGMDNFASGGFSTISGGLENRAETVAQYATVAGGAENQAIGRGSVISGGEENLSEGDHATVTGGKGNAAEGRGSTVSGGEDNAAAGDYSFAAGRSASAAHPGSFVWADSSEDAYSSTAEDQFLIRAAGGAVISGGETPANDPGDAQLFVDGTTRVRDLEFVSLSPSSGDELCITPGSRVVVCGSSGRLKYDVEPLQNAAELVKQMRPVRYRWKSDRQNDVGLIAEEVAEVLPEIVRFNQSGEAETLQYSRVAAVLVGAFQELELAHGHRLESLKQANARLHDEVAHLTRETHRLQQLAERNVELEDRLARLEAVLIRDIQVGEVTQ